jgi:hypothetical protein
VEKKFRNMKETKNLHIVLFSFSIFFLLPFDMDIFSGDPSQRAIPADWGSDKGRRTDGSTDTQTDRSPVDTAVDLQSAYVTVDRRTARHLNCKTTKPSQLVLLLQ